MKALLVILALVGDWEEAFDKVDSRTRESRESVDRLTEEITLLNLVNGLNLTKDQMTQVMALSREAVEVRDSTFTRHAEKVREFESALRELREVLAAGSRISPELEKKVQTCEAALKDIRRAYFATLNGIEGRLVSCLTKSQVAVIEPFNPCIIPPQDLKDPVRVGQAASETRDIEDHLYTIRALPGNRWQPAASALFDLFLTFEETLLGKFPDDRRAAEIERLMDLAARIRALPEDEFEMEKGKLATEVIKPIHDFQERTEELQQDFMRASGGLNKAGKFLLNPRIIPILEARLKVAADSGRTDLDTIDPADSCKDCGGDDKEAKRPTLEALGSEPRFEQVAAWLGLNGEQSDKARAAIGGAQVELLCTLSAPREDGRNILREFLGFLMHQKEKDAMALLGSAAPGGDKSYWQRIIEIKAAADQRLRNCLTGEQFDQYSGANLDIFKVKRPFGRRK